MKVEFIGHFSGSNFRASFFVKILAPFNSVRTKTEKKRYEIGSKLELSSVITFQASRNNLTEKLKSFLQLSFRPKNHGKMEIFLQNEAKSEK